VDEIDVGLTHGEGVRHRITPNDDRRPQAVAQPDQRLLVDAQYDVVDITDHIIERAGRNLQVSGDRPDADPAEPFSIGKL
jgi:hypothetical protein